MRLCICVSGGSSRRGQGIFDPEANDELRWQEVIGLCANDRLRWPDVIGLCANDRLRWPDVIGPWANDELRWPDVIGPWANDELRGRAMIQLQSLREGDEFAVEDCLSGAIISWTSRHEFRIFRAP